MITTVVKAEFSFPDQNSVNSMGSLIKKYPRGVFSKKHIIEKDGLDIRDNNILFEDKEQYVKGQILVKYKESAINISKFFGKIKENFFLKGMGFEKIDEIVDDNISLIKIDESINLEEKIVELQDNPDIEYAQPNFRYYPTAIGKDDYYKDLLWGLDNRGQTVYGVHGTMDSDIDAPEAWDVLARNSNEVIVAVIDTGIEYNHPDLEDHMWDGSNCVSDTGNALSNCIHGYDFEENDRDPSPNSIQDYDAEYPPHGTHIAGTIAAEENNGIGVTGVASNVKLMALKVDLTSAQIVKAINFAERNGAKIINASFGGSSYDTLELEAINNFSGLFVTSAGNGGSDGIGDNHDSGVNSYPCDFTASNIICVAATDQIDSIASFSDYGPTSVDVGAPGVNIFSTSSYDIIYWEDFEDEYEGTIPNTWIRGGINDTWGVRSIDFQSPVLSSNYWTPYPNNVNSYVASEVIDMYADKGTLIFYTNCDTEYSSQNWYDYMTLSFSGDAGFSYWENLRWDEAYIDDDFSSSGSEDYFFMRNIDPVFLTSQFRFKLGWVTDSYGNDYNGCYVDDLILISEGQNVEGYEFMDGTSMATPHVVGTAALIWGYRPDLSVSEVKDAILNSGDSVQSLQGKTVSGKRINAYNALKYVQGDVVDTFSFEESPGDQCFVNEKNKTINCDIRADAGRSELTPEISLTGGNISPASGVTNDFLTSSTYTFTKSDLSTENYTVNINIYFGTATGFRSGAWNWGVSNTKYTVSGDFDGDNEDEVAAMYDYGNEDMAIIVFEPNGSSFSTSTWFRSGAWNWGVPYTKYLTAGDYDGDGMDEIAAMYDYGNEDMAMIIFKSNGSSFGTSTWFRSGVGNWGVPYTKYLTAGDYDGDGVDEVSAMYDYGREDMAMIIFDSGGSTLFSTSTWFRSGPWNWGVPYTKYVTAGDYDGDGIDEVSAMYDYGNEDMAMIIFEPSDRTFSAQTWFRSGVGNWGVPYTKYLTAGDYDGDGIDEISAMYDYGNEDMAMIIFWPNGSSFSTQTWFRSGVGNWGVPYTKHVSSGDYNGNGIDEVSAMYDYGNEDMAVILFK